MHANSMYVMGKTTACCSGSEMKKEERKIFAGSYEEDLHWAPGIEWINESPRVVFKGLIGPGVATTTSSLFSILHPRKAWAEL